MCAASPGPGLSHAPPSPQSQSQVGSYDQRHPANSHAPPSPQSQSQVGSYDQRHPANIQTLRAFKAIIKSCYGPYGHLKMIQNQCGGHVTVTSSSHRLLKALSLSKPVLMLISAAVEGHLGVKSDGGLYVALLACSLIEACWEMSLHPALCVAVNEVIKDLYMKAMTSYRIPLDMSTTEDLLSLVASVISSKPGCGLVTHNVQMVSRLVIQSFLYSLPSVEAGQPMTIPDIEIIGVEAQAVSSSHMIEGVLVEAPDIPAFYTKELKAPRLETGLAAGCIRVVLFNISLAGDSEEYAEGSYEVAPGISSDAAALSAMSDLVDQIVDTRVGLVACQKVIHPSVKRHLREKGIVSIDRLSLLHVGAVQKITGAEMLSSCSSAIPASCFGHLTDIKHHVMFDRSYLHLTNAMSTQCTLVLCNHTEQALDELKHVCRVAHHTLALALSDPTALPGAGCLELILAHQLRQQTASFDESTWRDIGCTQTQFLRLSETFASCLEAVSMAINQGRGQLVTDSTSHHAWLLPPAAMADPDWLQGLERCCCGIMSANQLRDDEWSIVGSLKCGVHKVENKEVRETGRTRVGRARKTEEMSGNDKQRDTFKNASWDMQSVMHAGMSSSRLAKGAGREGGRKERVLDSYAVRYNGFRVAVDTANMVLRIGHTIEDIN